MTKRKHPSSRQERRRNHIAKDLGDSKYHQRVVPNKHRGSKFDDYDWGWDDDYDWLKDKGLTSKE